MNQHNVVFLFDKANKWLDDYIKKERFQDIYPNYTFAILYDSHDFENADIVFILGYTNILGKDFLSKSKINLVVHESNLPQGKGFAPVQWQVLEGKNKIPICLLEASEKVDSGDILIRNYFTLTGYELYDEIRSKQAFATIDLIHQFLKSYPNITKYKQKGEETFYPKRSSKDHELDVDKTIREQFNTLRIGNNEAWPSYFLLNGLKYTLKIYREEEK
mgnify:CR=1 FL=1